MRKVGRPKGTNPNHHLVLVKGVWYFRWVRGGKNRWRNTECPKSEVAMARKLRDKWIGEYAAQKGGVEDVPSVKSLGVVVDLYLEAESQPYDREKGGKQPGHKRSWKVDRTIVTGLKKHLDFSIAADLIDRERLLDAAHEMKGLAANTVRNRTRFLKRVYGWAKSNKRKTGVTVNPFAEIDEKADRTRIFPSGTTKEAPPYTCEQLKALYGEVPAHVYRPIRFAAHTGMRVGELLNMTWDRVDFEKRTYTTDPRVTKMGKERTVPLGDVALKILDDFQPAKVIPGSPVWLNSRDEPLRAFATIVKRAMKRKAIKKFFPEPRPGWRLPDLHSLRRTCASAVAQVAPHAVVKAILGHSAQDVTDLYITIPIDEQIAALNKAAVLIDGGTKLAVLTSRNVVENVARG